REGAQGVGAHHRHHARREGAGDDRGHRDERHPSLLPRLRRPGPRRRAGSLRRACGAHAVQLSRAGDHADGDDQHHDDHAPQTRPADDHDDVHDDDDPSADRNAVLVHVDDHAEAQHDLYDEAPDPHHHDDDPASQYDIHDQAEAADDLYDD